MKYLLNSYQASSLYSKILDIGFQFCSTALVVVQESLLPSQKCYALIKEIEGIGGIPEEVNEWPGTSLVGRTATVYKIPYSNNARAFFVSNNNSFLGWIAPDFPEDLALLRTNQQAWLTTIAHEGICYLQITEEESEYVKSCIPSLF